MRTIIISAYHGFIARAIFDSDFLDILRSQKNLRVIILIPRGKKDYFEKKYGGENIIIEEFDVENKVRKKSQKFLYRLGFLIQNSTYNKDQRLATLYTRRNNPIAWINFLCVSLAASIVSRLPLVGMFYRFLNKKMVSRHIFSSLIKKYRPDLIFSADIFAEQDCLLAYAADFLRIPIIGMVRSWDNTTTKGVLRFIPGKILVNTEVTKLELATNHGVPPRIIEVVGLPQFDRWYAGPTVNREEFFKKINLNSFRPLILFAPAGDNLTDIDWQICAILKKAMSDDKFSSRPQFLIRNHPAHPASLDNFEPDRNFSIEYPGIKFAEGYRGVELSPEDNSHLRNSIYYSDIILYIATSMGLDALTYSKPSIIINFDGWESKPRPFSVKRFNDEDCLNDFITSGGTLLANSEDELISYINRYLQDHDWRTKEIENAKHIYLNNPDGHAGQRIAEILLDRLSTLD